MAGAINARLHRLVRDHLRYKLKEGRQINFLLLIVDDNFVDSKASNNRPTNNGSMARLDGFYRLKFPVRKDLWDFKQESKKLICTANTPLLPSGIARVSLQKTGRSTSTKPLGSLKTLSLEIACDDVDTWRISTECP
jgi:hypothetical protein